MTLNLRKVPTKSRATRLCGGAATNTVMILIAEYQEQILPKKALYMTACTYKNYDELPLMLNVVQVSSVLGISRAGA